VWIPNWLKRQEDVPAASEQRLKILALSMCMGDCVSLRCLAQQHKWDLASPSRARCLSLSFTESF